jgi:sigma-E factor negative regulatory protein RseC
MAKKKGWVTDISENGQAQVIIERGDACNACEASHFCHSIADCSRIKTKVINQANASVGDRVTIELNSKTLFKSAFFLYLVPAFGLLGGAVSGNGLGNSLGIGQPGLTIILAFAGLAAGFTITAIFSRWMSGKDNLTPVVTKIVKQHS